MYRIAKVAVERTAYHFDKLYDYEIPPELEGLQPGCRVTVSFGGSRRRTGVVLALEETPEADQRRKPVLAQVDDQPVLNAEQLALLEYLKENTFCTYFEALKVLLPPGLGVTALVAYQLNKAADHDAVKLSTVQRQIVEYLRTKRVPCPEQELCEALSIKRDNKELEGLVVLGLVQRSDLVKRRVLDERMLMVELTPDWEEHKLTPKAASVARLLCDVGCGSVKEVCYFTGVTKAVTDRMVKAGTARYFEEERLRTPYADRPVQPPEAETTLSPHQQAAFEQLQPLLEQGGTALLHGVTGSGKTRVYLKLVEQTLAQGRQAIVLVPEISLTPQTVEFFRSRFGQQVAVIHSALSMSERLDEYKRISRGMCTLAVGTRSAVFAPFAHLGLIVVDEEQEHTYQSESSPRFDARDVAALRMKHHKGLLLLSSATPSVESYYAAVRGSMKLVTLRERYGTAQLPDVKVVDLRNPEVAGAEGLSLPLLDELEHNLHRGEQSILLLNRRGHSTQVKCLGCGRVEQCPNCDISMTYHAANGRLICHYCGHSQPVSKACPACGSELIRFSGLGTQRAQQRLEEIFPKARILRMDTDTTMSKFSFDRLLAEFRQGEYDILLGTQMVAKGLDFPKVTLVGVLLADQSLYSEDFRSFERTFSLITQVVGRCGRADLPGRALIQTFTPENPVIELAATQRYADFFEEEIGSRKLHLYPPFCRIYCVGFTGEQERDTAEAALWFAREFVRLAGEEYPDIPIRILGPAPATVARVAGRWRYKLLLKCRRGGRTHELLSRLLVLFGQQSFSKKAAVFIDTNYDSGF